MPKSSSYLAISHCICNAPQGSRLLRQAARVHAPAAHGSQRGRLLLHVALSGGPRPVLVGRCVRQRAGSRQRADRCASRSAHSYTVHRLYVQV